MMPLSNDDHAVAEFMQDFIKEGSFLDYAYFYAYFYVAMPIIGATNSF